MASATTSQSGLHAKIKQLRRRREKFARSLAKIDEQLVGVVKPKAKFGFYERVLVAAPLRSRRELLGQWGVVRGRVRERTGRWGYAVLVDSLKECYCFTERELTSSGQFEKPPSPSQIRTIRVRVDAQGRGTIVRPPQ